MNKSEYSIKCVASPFKILYNSIRVCCYNEMELRKFNFPLHVQLQLIFSILLECNCVSLEKKLDHYCI